MGGTRGLRSVLPEEEGAFKSESLQHLGKSEHTAGCLFEVGYRITMLVQSK